MPNPSWLNGERGRGGREGEKKRFKINKVKMNFRVNMVPIFASNYSTMQHVSKLASDIQQDKLIITNIK